MKSDIIVVEHNGTGFADALLQAEKCAVYRDLPQKPALHLRLLTEELLGIVRGIAGDVTMNYCVESEGMRFTIYLNGWIPMSGPQRSKFLDLSKTGKNSAAVGFTGKLRDFFENSLTWASSGGQTNQDPSVYDSLGAPEVYGGAAVLSGFWWSMKEYKEGIKEESSEWDELEKSVVAKLADDIKIGIRNNQVELIVYKDFTGY